MYLLNHFPTAEVTSVEISEDVFRASQDVLGLRYGICQARRLTEQDVEQRLVDISDFADAAYARSVASSTCRSEVVISDAWDYILYQSKGLLKAVEAGQSLEQLYYDLFVFDVYDQAATRWNGNKNTKSSPFVERASSDESLQAIQSLLRPREGIAVFHLHSDNQFQHYYDQIVRIFGADQVMLFAVTSNDHMVVAAKDKFRTPAHLTEQCSAALELSGDTDELGTCRGVQVHPCEKPIQFINSVEERNVQYGIGPRISKASLYALNCMDKANYYLAR